MGGRTPSVWDTFAANSGKIQDRSNPSVAVDFYNRYKEDIALMRSLGVRNFRMSISWSRLIPTGRKGGAVAPDAVRFYNAVLDELAANFISPAVTLYHWDMPQVLQDAYQGLTQPAFIEDFEYYADTAFRLFGGKVKKWTTFNEPWIVCSLQVRQGGWCGWWRSNRWPLTHPPEASCCVEEGLLQATACNGHPLMTTRPAPASRWCIHPLRCRC